MRKLFSLFLLLILTSPLVRAQWGDSPYLYGEGSNKQTESSERYEFVDSRRSKRSTKTRLPASFEIVDTKPVEKKEEPVLVQDPSPSFVAPKEESVGATQEEKLDTSNEKQEEQTWQAYKEDFIQKEEKKQDTGPSLSPIQPKLLRMELGFSERSVQSKSDYYPRSADLRFTGIHLSGQIITSKNSRAIVSYESSLLGTGKDNPNGSTQTEVDFLNMYVGGEFFLGNYDEKRSQFFLRLGYRELGLSVPKSSEYKLSWKSTGAELGFGSVFRWRSREILALYSIMPFNSHKETISSWSGKSGTSPKSFASELMLGYQQNWTDGFKIRYTIKRYKEFVSFSGDTEQADPVSSNTLTRTRVETESLSFGLHLLWDF